MHRSNFVCNCISSAETEKTRALLVCKLEGGVGKPSWSSLSSWSMSVRSREAIMPDQFSRTANVNSFWSHQMEGKEEVNILKSQINEERTYTRNEQLRLAALIQKVLISKLGKVTMLKLMMVGTLITLWLCDTKMMIALSSVWYEDDRDNQRYLKC